MADEERKVIAVDQASFLKAAVMEFATRKPGMYGLASDDNSVSIVYETSEGVSASNTPVAMLRDIEHGEGCECMRRFVAFVCDRLEEAARVVESAGCKESPSPDASLN